MKNKNKILIIIFLIICIFVIILFLSNLVQKDDKTVHTEINSIDSTYVDEVEESTQDISVEKNEDIITTSETEFIENTNDTTENVETINDYYCTWGDFYLTEEEFELVCTTVMCETGSSKEPFESKVLVATVIFNQLLDNDIYDEFPNTIKEVIYYKNGGNYSVVNLYKFKRILKNREWTEEIENAIETALKNNPYPRDLLYFRTDYYHTFGKPYKKCGNTYFSTRN